MSIKLMMDVKSLGERVTALEGKATAAVGEVVTVAKADWEALIARVEAIEAKVLKKPKAS